MGENKSIMDNNSMIFDRFLLFHPQRDLTYIRKLSMSYGYYTALAVVNENNRVTHIGVSNSFNIVSFKELTENDKNILGSERCSHLELEDLLSIYRINKALKLNYHYKLMKPCRNMRYTLPLETYELKKLIISTLSEENLEYQEEKIQLNNYNDAYSDHVELDLENIDLTEEITSLELPNFNSLNATGQTKLL